MNRFLKKHRETIPHMRLINKFDTYDYVVGIGFPKEKILYIPAFYLDFDLFKPADCKKKGLVFCGRLEKNKGLDLLIEAIRIVAKKMPDIRLKIIGDGSEKKWLDEKIREYGLNIEMLGWLPTREDVARVYQESEVILMTSYNEGGPRVTLEAMACGCLCVSTRVGVMREVVRDGENALFIDWDPKDIADKILWATTHAEEVSEIAEEGRKSIRKFEYATALKKYFEEYDKIS